MTASSSPPDRRIVADALRIRDGPGGSDADPDPAADAASAPPSRAEALATIRDDDPHHRSSAGAPISRSMVRSASRSATSSAGPTTIVGTGRLRPRRIVGGAVDVSSWRDTSVAGIGRRARVRSRVASPNRRGAGAGANPSPARFDPDAERRVWTAARFRDGRSSVRGTLVRADRGVARSERRLKGASRTAAG